MASFISALALFILVLSNRCFTLPILDGQPPDSTFSSGENNITTKQAFDSRLVADDETTVLPNVDSRQSTDEHLGYELSTSSTNTTEGSNQVGRQSIDNHFENSTQNIPVQTTASPINNTLLFTWTSVLPEVSTSQPFTSPSPVTTQVFTTETSTSTTTTTTSTVEPIISTTESFTSTVATSTEESIIPTTEPSTSTTSTVKSTISTTESFTSTATTSTEESTISSTKSSTSTRRRRRTTTSTEEPTIPTTESSTSTTTTSTVESTVWRTRSSTLPSSTVVRKVFKPKPSTSTSTSTTKYVGYLEDENNYEEEAEVSTKPTKIHRKSGVSSTKRSPINIKDQSEEDSKESTVPTAEFDQQASDKVPNVPNDFLILDESNDLVVTALPNRNFTTTTTKALEQEEEGIPLNQGEESSHSEEKESDN